MTQAALMERGALDQMEPRLRNLGYALVREPSAEQLPSFLRGFRPDAIAIGRKPGLVIEVVGRPNPSADTKLSQLRNLFTGQEDWSLVVVYAASDKVEVEAAPLADVDSALSEADRSAEQEPRSALLLAWTALAALHRARHPELASGGLAASTLLDLLVSPGDLPQVMHGELQQMARMRNALAHGQLDLRPTPDTVRRLVDVARSLRPPARDRKSVGEGTSVAVRVDPGGRRVIKKKK